MIADSYLVADPVFFEVPEQMADQAELFDVTLRRTPEGWGRAERGLWVGWQPLGLALPAQGWKVHLSVHPDHAQTSLDETVDFCVAHRFAVKFLRSSRAHRLTNLKYATRGYSGKLAAIYPEDDTRLEQLLAGLGARLAGVPGPYVLGDLRWGGGPLYLRYGAFLDRWAAGEDDGEPTLAIERPDRSFEPDRREPVFRVPAWVPTPQVVQAAVAAVESGVAGLPVQVLEALHHSNAGGVYLAEDAAGVRVVVKEARPHAGLDPAGRDAVDRLGHEAAVLRRLESTGATPRCLHEFTAWEHHFLVEDLVDGASLHSHMAQHHPYLHPDPSPAEVVAYTSWALALTDGVAAALEAVHGRGIVFADLHANNIMVRPDGSVMLIDAELATELEGGGRVLLGDPAFRHREISSGRALDDYALACLRLSVFIPLTGLLVWDPDLTDGGTAERLIDAAMALFPLGDGWGESVLAGLRAVVHGGASAKTTGPGRRALRTSTSGRNTPPSSTSRPAPIDADPADLSRRLIEGALSWSSPERRDRLFPADPAVFAHGGCGLAYGAAGVLHAAASIAPELVEGEHLDWLARTALSSDSPYTGLYAGTAGAALVLARLGRVECALEVFARSRQRRSYDTTIGLFNGAAGLGLAAMTLSSQTGDATPALDDIAETELGALRRLLHGSPSHLTDPLEAGLLRGWSGAAVCLVRRYEQTGEATLLDDAVRALRRDLEECVVDDAGALHVRDGARILLYLGDGAIGVGLALQAVLRHRDDADLVAALAAVRRTCRIGVVMFGGLFNGRAGLLLGASLLLEGDERVVVSALHRERLAWHLVAHEGRPALPGDGLVRLSADLATGAAGAALALGSGARPADHHDVLLLGAGSCALPIAPSPGAGVPKEVNP